MRNRAHVKLSIRVPAEWAGQVNSAQLEKWLSDFVDDPFLLPRDRGPGEGFIIRLSVSRELLHSFRRKVRGASSSALRRLISTHLNRLAVAELPGPPDPLSPLAWHELVVSPERWRTFCGVTGRSSFRRGDSSRRRKKR
jgi:hypothetical protein